MFCIYMLLKASRMVLRRSDGSGTRARTSPRQRASQERAARSPQSLEMLLAEVGVQAKQPLPHVSNVIYKLARSDRFEYSRLDPGLVDNRSRI